MGHASFYQIGGWKVLLLQRKAINLALFFTFNLHVAIHLVSQPPVLASLEARRHNPMTNQPTTSVHQKINFTL